MVFRVALLLSMVVLSGCAAVMQTEPRLGFYSHLLVGNELDKGVHSVEILQIQRIGDPEIFYDPKPNNGFLWLRPGKYTAKLRCNSKSDNHFMMYPMTTSFLSSDSSVDFDIETDFFGIDCQV